MWHFLKNILNALTKHLLLKSAWKGQNTSVWGDWSHFAQRCLYRLIGKHLFRIFSCKRNFYFKQSEFILHQVFAQDDYSLSLWSVRSWRNNMSSLSTGVRIRTYVYNMNVRIQRLEEIERWRLRSRYTYFQYPLVNFIDRYWKKNVFLQVLTKILRKTCRNFHTAKNIVLTIFPKVLMSEERIFFCNLLLGFHTRALTKRTAKTHNYVERFGKLLFGHNMWNENGFFCYS